MEEFKIEFEDEDFFDDVYGRKKGFSYGGEVHCGSLESVMQRGLSYGGEISISKLDISMESDGKKSLNWF